LQDIKSVISNIRVNWFFQLNPNFLIHSLEYMYNQSTNKTQNNWAPDLLNFSLEIVNSIEAVAAEQTYQSARLIECN